MKFRRHNYLTMKVFQWRFAGISLLFMALTSVLVVATVYFTGWALLKERLYPYYSEQMFFQVFWEMNVLLLFRLLLIAPLVIILAIILSHRMAGPLYRIEKILDKVSHGDFGVRIKLRKSDKLKDLAESINKILDNVEDTIKKNQNKKEV